MQFHKKKITVPDCLCFSLLFVLLFILGRQKLRPRCIIFTQTLTFKSIAVVIIHQFNCFVDIFHSDNRPKRFIKTLFGCCLHSWHVFRAKWLLCFFFFLLLFSSFFLYVVLLFLIAPL